MFFFEIHISLAIKFKMKSCNRSHFDWITAISAKIKKKLVWISATNARLTQKSIKKTSNCHQTTNRLPIFTISDPILTQFSLNFFLLSNTKQIEYFAFQLA